MPIGGPAAQAGWLGPKVGGHLAPFLYSSREPSELSQWLCYDDSTINIVVIIVIIIIIIIITAFCTPVTVRLLGVTYHSVCAVITARLMLSCRSFYHIINRCFCQLYKCSVHSVSQFFYLNTFLVRDGSLNLPVCFLHSDISYIGLVMHFIVAYVMMEFFKDF